MIRSYIYRIFDAIVRYYRKGKFRFEVRCPHRDFKLVGSITVINRNVSIGRGVTIYQGVMFWGDGPIVIGNGVSIGNNTVIYSSKQGGVTIGDYTQIAAQCYIIDMDHGISVNNKISEQNNSVAAVSIGEDCWLEANVTVLKGSIINNGAVIGAKSLVKGIVPKDAVAVGIPEKVIKYRQ